MLRIWRNLKNSIREYESTWRIWNKSKYIKKIHIINFDRFFCKALDKEEQYTVEIKQITQRIKEAEVRAEHGERELNKLNSEVLRLEGNNNNINQLSTLF